VIHEHVELHNVAEVQPIDSGVRLQRVPEAVRRELNETARMRVRQADNCEVRFVADGDVELTLSSVDQTHATVFHGPFDSRQRYVLGPDPTTIRVAMPERLGQLAPEFVTDQPFSPAVCRVVFGGRRRDAVMLHDIRGRGVRPPLAEELPMPRYLAYGTSITQGFDCDGPQLSYVGQTAWHLGADLINLGVGGACHCEPAFAEHIAGRTDWHIATLELSVNMRGFTLDEFHRRVEYMIHAIAGSDPARPVVCITLFPFFADFGLEAANANPVGSAEQYRQALRDVVADSPHANVHLIEGPELLKNIGGLTADLIHPSDHAMIEIGCNLADRLKAIASGPTDDRSKRIASHNRRMNG